MSIKDEFLVLAKSKPEINLFVHTDDCLEVLEQVKVCMPNVPVRDAVAFWYTLYMILILHDTGKGHIEFQRFLKELPNQWYLQRHELFSLVFVEILKVSSKLKERIRFAVCGHHKSLDELFTYVRHNYKNDGRGNGLIGDEKVDFKDECKKVDIANVVRFLAEYGLFTDGSGEEFDVHKGLREIMNGVQTSRDVDFIEYLLLVGGMKQCDHLASAGIRSLQKIEVRDFDFLYTYSLYTHQQKASDTVGNAILSAITGSGKTETALFWLKRQFENRGQGRVFFILPSIASINAMYERLESKFGVGKVGMLHGKVAEYLEYKMMDERGGQEMDRSLLEEYKTLATPLKVVTPFQLLKNLFGLRNFEKGMFEWMGGYFIFDEIHAYDPNVFAQVVVLIRFIVKYLNGRVFVMTATLPRYLHEELGKALGNYTSIQADIELKRAFTRHRVQVVKGKLFNHLPMIQEKLDAGERVLVVCNTVAEAQKVFINLHSSSKVLLHGSFNSEDRFEKERSLRNDDVKLLVGTQAIEVSLDIDYSVLFSEPAPLDALIQRFGRINRKRKKGICDCFVFEDRNYNDKFVYPNERLITKTIQVLQKLEKEGVVREEVLDEAIEYVYSEWDKEERMEYERTLNLLEYSVVNELSPLRYSSEKEELFYQQFSGVRVLPIEYWKEYQYRLDTHQFIRAEALLVPLSEKRFAKMLRKEQVFIEKIVIGSKKSKIFHDKSVIIIRRKYDKDLGLLIDELGS